MSPEAATWEDTLPHISVSEKGSRITAPPLETSGMLGFVFTVTVLLWTPAATATALFAHAVSSESAPPPWWWLIAVPYMFLPGIATGLTADEARDRYGQRRAANRVATIPLFAGAAAGLLIGAVWVGGFRGGLMALASLAFACCAALATLAAWWDIRRARQRLAWMAWMRRHGVRAPGVLRNTTFLNDWVGAQPQFQVLVAYGSQRVTANMTTTTDRVPLPGSAVQVLQSPTDPHGEVLIELDSCGEPRFDAKPAKYTRPSGN